MSKKRFVKQRKLSRELLDRLDSVREVKCTEIGRVRAPDWLVKEAQEVREGLDRLVNDPDFRPELSARHLQYVQWKRGLDPSYMPTMADLVLLAAEDAREVYKSTPTPARDGETPPGAGAAIDDGDPQVERDCSIEGTLLSAMTAVKRHGKRICELAGVDYTSHSKAVLAALVKRGACTNTRGPRGGYARKS